MVILKKKIRIVNARRLALTTLLLFLAILMSLSLLVKVVNGVEPVLYKVHVVESGDTLWEIAEIYNGDDDDTRKLVYEIASYNNIGGNDHIYPNQKLMIPIDR
ncbi:LysM peptidoglycan-binding domain-containing protein [Alkalibacter mobilis]|uniref:LysM peptidoglycan-binding domain-containing protein n=1 Tax=Alkalibacter mobilis TaxID=2787712 RepID=UPI0018A06149|nr:LysM domain-containing protein [Alkalibacter mobilis]MBF7097618.1 LysM peptidoglycan-binding domain-containing protein [Alkalibacter mobilis]